MQDEVPYVMRGGSLATSVQHYTILCAAQYMDDLQRVLSE